jgi:hypothetical protein
LAGVGDEERSKFLIPEFVNGEIYVSYMKNTS